MPNPIVLGKFGSTYGVRGWIKVYSYTDPSDNLQTYPNWQVKFKGAWQPLPVEGKKKHGNILIAKIRGIESPEEVHKYTNCLIGVYPHDLPALAPGEYYWSQLEGLTVTTASGQTLGKIDHLLSTEGSNDVMVVIDADGRECLIPYLKSVVLAVDLDTKQMRVDWELDADVDA